MRTKLSLAFTASVLLMLPFAAAPAAADDQGAPSGALQFPLADAVVHDRTLRHSYSVSEYNLGHHLLTLSWTSEPQTRAKFQGADALVVVSNYTSTADGAPVSTTTDMDYYSPSTQQRIGVVVTIKNKQGTETRFSTVVHANPLPKTAKIGDSGQFEFIAGYTDASKSRMTTKRATSWSLERDPQSAADALFCVSEEVQSAATSDVRQAAKECYHEDTSGAFSRPYEVQQLISIMH